jgi:hypothetical protein
MMRPALDHGISPGCMSGPEPARTGWPLRLACSPVNDVTLAVIVPSPVRVWCAKLKLSVTTSPPGPCGMYGRHARPVRGAPLALWQPMLEFPAANRPTNTVSTPATIMPITQPRTVRNLVHSEHSSEPNPPPRVLASAAAPRTDMVSVLIARPPRPAR